MALEFMTNLGARLAKTIIISKDVKEVLVVYMGECVVEF